MQIKDINFYTPKAKPAVTDGEVARQEIALLLNTIPTEKPFDSNYGVDTQAYLFDLITYDQANALYNEIIEKIKIYVKTVRLDESRSSVTVNDDLDGYDIELVFQLVNADENGTNFVVTKEVTKNV